MSRGKSSIDEFRIKVIVRNNLLLSAIEAAGFAGFGGLARFSEFAGVASSNLSALISMRTPPLTAGGEFSLTAKLVMEALGAAPEDLWAPEQLTLRLSRNSAERTCGAAEVEALLSWRDDGSPEDAAERMLARKTVEHLIERSGLRKGERRALMLFHGIGGGDEMSYPEVGKVMGLSRARVQQLEQKALRKVKDRVHADIEAGVKF